MILGKAAVKSFPNQGMPEDHIDAFCTVATQRDEVILVRPVEAICRTLLVEGYPTKGFHVKGKSSNWGPQAGFVCVEQKYSKLADRPEDIPRFDIQTRSCIAEGYAVASQLTISRKRLEELRKMGLLANVRIDNVRTGPGDTGSHLRFEAKSRNGPLVTFLAQRQNGERYAISVEERAWKVEPLMVLADPRHGPLTADYDLFAICPRWERLSLGTQDRMQVTNVSHKVLEKRIDQYQNRPHFPHGPRSSESLTRSLAQLKESAKPGNFYAKEDREVGNVTARIMACKVDLNRAIGRGPGLDTVHHNADSGSPATDMTANFPCPAFHPRSFGRYQDACMLENVAELKDFFQLLLDEGYYVPRNPLWSDLVGLRSGRFQEARQRLGNALRGR